MKLSIEAVEKIANLARLGLTNEEKEKFAEQLSAILDYVDQLKEVDAITVAPIAQITGLQSVMRSDEIEDCDSETIKKLLEQAPEIKDNLVKTRAVFE